VGICETAVRGAVNFSREAAKPKEKMLDEMAIEEAVNFSREAAKK
jgi:hypothetical protein